MVRTCLRPRGFARTPDLARLTIDYDVVIVQEDGREIVVSSTDKAAIGISVELAEDIARLFAQLGQHMERAVGLETVEAGDEKDDVEGEEL